MGVMACDGLRERVRRRGRGLSGKRAELELLSSRSPLAALSSASLWKLSLRQRTRCGRSRRCHCFTCSCLACAYSCALPCVSLPVHGDVLSACVCECMRIPLAARCRFCARPSPLQSDQQPVDTALPLWPAPLRAATDGLCCDARREALRLWRLILRSAYLR